MPASRTDHPARCPRARPARPGRSRDEPPGRSRLHLRGRSRDEPPTSSVVEVGDLGQVAVEAGERGDHRWVGEGGDVRDARPGQGGGGHPQHRSGGSSQYHDLPIQRIFRDVQILNLHAITNPSPASSCTAGFPVGWSRTRLASFSHDQRCLPCVARGRIRDA
ncbi:hypothetical protein [Solwaraspora sp. WMMD791]|uniref:hypothetical protein n=1 Tax=Solwaraspora sp. WMMD791 TaxID=3016086 RepID=UPI0032B57342